MISEKNLVIRTAKLAVLLDTLLIRYALSTESEFVSVPKEPLYLKPNDYILGILI